MAKYSVKDPNLEKLEELCRIAHNLRHYSKKWKEQYGAPNRNAMASWEQKMDEFLAKNIDYIDVSDNEKNLDALRHRWVDVT